MKPRRVNVKRMQKYRHRFDMQFERYTFDRDYLLNLIGGASEWQNIQKELVKEFALKMRAKYWWVNRRYELKLIVHQDFDIDFYRDRLTIECTPRRISELNSLSVCAQLAS